METVKDMTRPHFTGTWIRNAILNGRNRYIQDLEHIPAFPIADEILICGTGPSLNKDFIAIRTRIMNKAKNQMLIIANHSNLSTLLYEGIVPHMVVVADSGDPTFLRIKRDVLPHFKSVLRHAGTAFIMPTHAHPKLIDILLDAKMSVFYFLSLFRNETDDEFNNFYNQALFAAAEPEREAVHTCILQAGSVTNAAVLVCNALKMLNKIPLVTDVRLTGVDYSYPHGITRCRQVTWNSEVKDFDVEDEPVFLGEEILRVKCNGLPTSEEQLAYYRDLRFINKNLVEMVKPEERVFNISTTQDNFIADFLPVIPL